MEKERKKKKGEKEKEKEGEKEGERELEKTRKKQRSDKGRTKTDKLQFCKWTIEFDFNGFFQSLQTNEEQTVWFSRTKIATNYWRQ